jgi:hypothetical protein
MMILRAEASMLFSTNSATAFKGFCCESAMIVIAFQSSPILSRPAFFIRIVYGTRRPPHALFVGPGCKQAPHAKVAKAAAWRSRGIRARARMSANLRLCLASRTASNFSSACQRALAIGQFLLLQGSLNTGLIEPMVKPCPLISARIDLIPEIGRGTHFSDEFPCRGEGYANLNIREGHLSL